jgi:predicted RNA-binding protein with PUA-like domain
MDSEKPESMREYKETVQELDVEASSGKPRVWIFQANPERYDLLNCLADRELIDDVWMVNRYKNQIHAGDVGLIWMSGKDAGIYAVADITSDPDLLVESPLSARCWVSEEDKSQERLRVEVKYKLKLVFDPIRREELKNIPELKNMAILGPFPQGTNFPVTNEEWTVILELLKKRYGFSNSDKSDTDPAHLEMDARIGYVSGGRKHTPSPEEKIIKDKQAQYANFVNELKRKGITGKEYREKIIQWENEHQEE